MNKNICIVPGMFDPVTIGHLDIICRAAKLFDIIYVTSFDNSAKKTMFTSDERLEMLKLACEGIEGGEKITVDVTNELLVDYAKSKGAKCVVKGVRNTIDYEYEYNLSMINRNIGENIETIFFPAKPEHLFISSTFVKEMILYKRDLSDYIPEKVKNYIAEIMQNKTVAQM
jgi:pantetheine-phosphate adenylyltransferase